MTAAAFLLACQVAGAQRTISDTVVGRQGGRKFIVAVPPAATAPGLEALGRELANVVSYDLDFSCIFSVIPWSEYPPGFTGFTRDAGQIDLPAWRTTDAEFLIHCYLEESGDQYRAEYRLFEVMTGQQVAGKEMLGKRQWPRHIAHRFSEEVIRMLTGELGIGTSSICFSGGQTGRKEIYVADYDGANTKQVTQHGSVSILPKFSPDGRWIAYLSYKERFPFLYILDLETGDVAPLSKSVGLNGSPVWSPKADRLAFSVSRDGNAEIYLVDPDGTGQTRVTNDRAVDTSPAFSPSGDRLAFVSERVGSPQIFVMNVDGSDVRRVSYQGGRSYDPAWSPNGEFIAYVVERRGEGLEIYVLALANNQYKRLTDSAGSNEAPAWSPDSRHIMFTSTRTGRSELWAVNFETLESRRIPSLAMSCQGPDWGPRRK